MLLRREGFPEEGEIVYCRVERINPHSVFVNLVEYDKHGLINISEVSPGRIRNLRDFVVEGRFIVCKVLRVDPQKGHIDLSLRRVNEQQRRIKNMAIKQEEKAEKILDNLSKEKKKDFRKVFDELWSKCSKDYDYVFQLLEDVAEGENTIKNYIKSKTFAEFLDKKIKEIIRPKEVEISKKVKIESEKENGIEIIRNALLNTEGKGVVITYLGGSKYLIKLKEKDYKKAEAKMREILSGLEEELGHEAEMEVLK